MQVCSNVIRNGKFRFLRNISAIALNDNNSLCIRKRSGISMVTTLLNQFSNDKIAQKRFSTIPGESKIVDYITYEKVCEETLESLTEYFEELIENAQHLKLADIAYSSGVLTVNFGSPYGTYVINRQTPNKQIWLSSPTSGPKRYDYDTSRNCWIYKHDGKSLHRLLQDEVPLIVKSQVDFSRCSYSLV